MADESIGITAIEARYILEAIDCAYSEGIGGKALGSNDAHALEVRLADFAGVNHAEYWWLERPTVRSDGT